MTIAKHAALAGIITLVLAVSGPGLGAQIFMEEDDEVFSVRDFISAVVFPRGVATTVDALHQLYGWETGWTKGNNSNMDFNGGSPGVLLDYPQGVFHVAEDARAPDFRIDRVRLGKAGIEAFRHQTKYSIAWLLSKDSPVEIQEYGAKENERGVMVFAYDADWEIEVHYSDFEVVEILLVPARRR